MRIVVFKVGGSLLEMDGLAARLRAILALRGDAKALLVVGGGPAADLVRDWFALHRLSQEQAHWLALGAMRLNEDLLLSLLPEAEPADSRAAALAAWRRSGIVVARAQAIMLNEESDSPVSLPHNWDVTSDSIAAWIARCWSAEELVLLKSTSLPEACDAAEARRRLLVDPHFFRMATVLPRIGWANLREAHPRIESWPIKSRLEMIEG